MRHGACITEHTLPSAVGLRRSVQNITGADASGITNGGVAALVSWEWNYICWDIRNNNMYHIAFALYGFTTNWRSFRVRKVYWVIVSWVTIVATFTPAIAKCLHILTPSTRFEIFFNIKCWWIQFVSNSRLHVNKVADVPDLFWRCYTSFVGGGTEKFLFRTQLVCRF